jgi:hypothetical protein
MTFQKVSRLHSFKFFSISATVFTLKAYILQHDSLLIHQNRLTYSVIKQTIVSDEFHSSSILEKIEEI